MAIELNGRFEPKYRHEISGLLMQSYSEVRPICDLLFLFVELFCVKIGSVFALVFGCGKRLGHFRIHTMSMARRVEHM